MSAESDKIKLSDLVYVAAGAVDVTLTAMQQPLRRLQSQLRRSDLADIAGEGHDDLRVRGRLAVRRLRPEPHLEHLAQRAIARRAAGHSVIPEQRTPERKAAAGQEAIATQEINPEEKIAGHDHA
ncbi:hypothetical protein ACGFNU_33330 [Spirillospora sp. NPDC048911]|uniref:hypothetical protein n=1 Tax=Spirillospora sp. NPDC048911 TaxID=3364527 RepID=UPI0037180584